MSQGYAYDLENPIAQHHSSRGLEIMAAGYMVPQA
jgi:hypothetical protein